MARLCGELLFGLLKVLVRDVLLRMLIWFIRYFIIILRKMLKYVKTLTLSLLGLYT